MHSFCLYFNFVPIIGILAFLPDWMWIFIDWQCVVVYFSFSIYLLTANDLY